VVALPSGSSGSSDDSVAVVVAVMTMVLVVSVLYIASGVVCVRFTLCVSDVYTSTVTKCILYVNECNDGLANESISIYSA
jgi:hypothetical protein